MSEPVRVAVSIATFRRPEGLSRLLEGIARQTFAGSRPQLRVVVVDNDAESTTTEPIIERWRSQLGELVLQREPRQGISFARNRGLDAAGEVDFVALIDDDEVPDEGWLDELLRVQRRYRADVVRGPVIPRFESEPPQWILDGGFFDRPRYPTGTVLDRAFTHNVLFRWDPYGRDHRFSPRYAKSGGSDTHYFSKIYLEGARIVWADDAVVYEYNPPGRQSLAWLLRRQYRIGLVRAAIDAELALTPSPRRDTATQAWRRMVAGASGLAASALGPSHRRAKSLAMFCSGLGRAAGLAGLWFEEYRGS